MASIPLSDRPGLPLVEGGAPLLGHLLQFFRDPVSVLTRGYRTRGRLFALSFMGRRMNVMLGPEHNRFFFEETDKLLSIRESMPFFLKMFSPEFYSFAEMEEYLRQRAIIMPRFKAASMKQYVPVMVEESLNLVNRLGDEGSFDLIPTLGPVVMDIAAHSFMGREFHEKLGHEFFELFRDFSGGMEFVLPLWLPTPKMVRSQRAKRKLHAILQSWIDKRRAAPLDPPDFFQDMIATTYPDGRPVPDEIIRHLILLLVWAGHETTAGQVSWALADLLQNPGYQAVIRAELAAQIGGGDGRELGWQQAIAMEKMDLALRETERLHPVAYLLSRKAREDIERDGYQIRKGEFVLLAPSVSHRLEETFPEPDRYDPERFNPANPAAKTESNTLIGFGGGVHRCAGVNFARMEMKVLLAILLQHYDMELIDEVRPIAGAGTYWPAQPCRVRYRKRRLDGASPTAAQPAATGCPVHGQPAA
ncbi:cytochrome P450 [Novosphingobium flavum]|uniref:Cytochrome P450 n=1 Tax=Novosphingobium aerophilum TaxID=2839843 RepID=A0A7X1F4I7_9SPHN|nr:cytochrome P450 [Novosphingobium aerophilum]MBC2650245.1 cytochrome P450 [Novosphingobium aerophilum]MBC2660206.1 cytochrome P450 [Novosphingobium aerophilum]